MKRKRKITLLGVIAILPCSTCLAQIEAKSDCYEMRVEANIAQVKCEDGKPTLKIKPWDNDEVWLQWPKEAALSFSAQKALTAAGMEWKQDGDKLRWLFRFDAKPKSNTYTLQLGGNWRDFAYHYQAPFESPESYIQDGEEHLRQTDPDGTVRGRPRSVDGSYAVYHKSKRHNQYRCGKAFHILVPKATDAKGIVSWCSLHIDDRTGVYTVTIDQKFLDAAVYPVVVNDTFGASDVGASNVFLAANIHVLSGTTGVSGTATSMSIAVYDGDFASCTMGLYSGASNPLSLVEDTGEVSLGNNVDDVFSSDFDSSVALASGTTYYPAAAWSGAIKVRYDSGTNVSDRVAQTYTSGTLDSPISPTLDETWLYSIWVTYTASGGSPAHHQVIYVSSVPALIVLLALGMTFADRREAR